MKNIIITFFVFILCMPLSHAGFYSDIEKNIDEINLKTYNVELQGKSGIKDKINDILDKNGENIHIIKEINKEDIKGEIDIVKIYDFIGLNNGKLTYNKLNNIKKIIEEYKDNSKEISDRKSKNIKKLLSLGIYSDGIVKNAEFDLLEDIRLIDNEIFNKKIKFDYDGEERDSNIEIFNKYIQNNNKVINKILKKHKKEKKDNILINNKEKKKNNILINNKTKEKKKIILSNNYSCTDGSGNILSNNGLDNNNLDEILNDIKAKTDNGTILIEQKNKIKKNKNNDKLDDNKIDDIPNGGYSVYRPVNDNSEFPCDSVFCIKIESIKYKHALLGGWTSDSISIEYLLERSNKHIGKFASNSLLPSKMPNENFEIGFKDLNLKDMFHIGFQVTSKPVPILKLVKKEEKDNSEFSAKNLLQRYYEALGLDYKRSNDLSIYKSKIKELKTINDSAELSLSEVTEKQYELNDIEKKKEKIIQSIEKSIENKATNEVLSDFEKQFSELEFFSVSILNYSEKVDSFIRQMNKIPSKS